MLFANISVVLCSCSAIRLLNVYNFFSEQLTFEVLDCECCAEIWSVNQQACWRRLVCSSSIQKHVKLFHTKTLLIAFTQERVDMRMSCDYSTLGWTLWLHKH